VDFTVAITIKLPVPQQLQVIIMIKQQRPQPHTASL
jgi:hypothetical protein